MNWKYKNETEFEIPSTAFGFIYRIECTMTEPERSANGLTKWKYIGRKYLTAVKTTSKRVLKKDGTKTTKKSKTRSESDWRSYMGSCKPLLADIARFGADKFKFEIIAFAETKGQVNMLECMAQFNANVLGDPSYYNDAIGSGQFRGVSITENFKKVLTDITTQQ